MDRESPEYKAQRALAFAMSCKPCYFCSVEITSDDFERDNVISVSGGREDIAHRTCFIEYRGDPDEE